MNDLYRLTIILTLTLLMTAFPLLSSSQEGNMQISPEKITEYKAEVQNLVSFLEYSFNMLGNPLTTARDKDVIINQSYAKIFRDADVQVEDDLDDNRQTLINKDVQAYLKDIDFFFTEAVFSLNVSSVDHSFTAAGDLYFTVSLTRTLNGRSVTGDTVSSNKERFIEVNYDPVAQDLRIVSIYTTKIDEKDELFAWWNTMPGTWREIIGHDALITDTIRMSKVVEISDTMAIIEYRGVSEMPVDTFLVYGPDTLFIDETEYVEGIQRDSIALKKNLAYRLLQRLSSETEIDISGNLNINSLEPLARMGDLKKVNCSGTLIDDLSPLRSLSGIEALDCSGTAITSIAPLKYSVSLTALDLSYTLTGDLGLLANLRNLEKLNISNTPSDSIYMLSEMVNLNDLRMSNTLVGDITPLSRLKKLRLLNCSGTNVRDLSALQGLVQLEWLYLNNTPVEDLGPLSALENLQTIYLDSTNVNNLQPLSGLPELEKIYCDNTGITDSKANKFMAENPRVLVVYESVALTRWWKNMSPAWKAVFSDMASLDPVPSKEQLHHVAKVTAIDVSGNPDIRDLSPLKSMSYLTTVNCSNTGIDNLLPLADLIDLSTLDCSHTAVSNCDPLHDLINLEHLNISHTQINDIQCLSGLGNIRHLDITGTGVSVISVLGKSSIETIYGDGTGITLSELIAFKKDNPDCTVVYQTPALESWWHSLGTSWKNSFIKAAGVGNDPGPFELQRIADLTAIDISQNKDLGSLSPLNVLYRLKELKMNDTQTADLSPVSGMTSIESLVISNNPIEKLTDIAGLVNLRYLDFKNTPVDDVEPLGGLVHLVFLDLSGTQVKKLDELENLTALEQISFYNTEVKSLDPLEALPALKLIKCYNTRLKEKKVSKFSEIRPDCEIIFY
jgi:hypothetical protein